MDGLVQFGYAGQRTEDVAAGISVDDVTWLLQYLGKVTDAQLRAGLVSSGASAEEQAIFATALRARITQLQDVVRSPRS